MAETHESPGEELDHLLRGVKRLEVTRRLALPAAALGLLASVAIGSAPISLPLGGVVAAAAAILALNRSHVARDRDRTIALLEGLHTAGRISDHEYSDVRAALRQVMEAGTGSGASQALPPSDPSSAGGPPQL